MRCEEDFEFEFRGVCAQKRPNFLRCENHKWSRWIRNRQKWNSRRHTVVSTTDWILRENGGEMRGEYCIAFVYIYLCIKTTRQSLPIIRLSKIFFHRRPLAPNAALTNRKSCPSRRVLRWLESTSGVLLFCLGLTSHRRHREEVFGNAQLVDASKNHHCSTPVAL